MKTENLIVNALFFANTDWYLFNFRQALMRAVEDCGYGIHAVSPPGEYGERLRSLGIAWQALPFARNSRLGMLFSLWRTRQALRRLVRDTSPGIIHSFTLTSVLLTWLAGPHGDSVRRINAVTGLGYAFTGRSFKHRLMRLVLRPFLRRALGSKGALTVVQNADDREFLIETFRLRPETVRLIAGSGVDTDRFKPTSRLVETDHVVIGFVGRLLTDKGLAEFVEAARDLAGQFPQARFVVAGSSDPGNPAAIGQLQLNAWASLGVVEFVGQVDDMRGFFGGLDIFVLPSYREGLSRSLIEAGACGLPAVTTDVPGCRDVVRHGDNGFLAPPRDGQALAAAIAALIKDADLRRRMGQRARQVVEERFSDEVINRQTLELYRSLGSRLKAQGSGRKESG